MVRVICPNGHSINYTPPADVPASKFVAIRRKYSVFCSQCPGYFDVEI